MNHTPGPWSCGNGTQYEPITNVYCDDDLGSVVATCAHRHNLAIPVSQEVANAQLIAASPDLLEVAQGLLRYVEWINGDKETHPQQELLDKTRAAIAKATGTSERSKSD